ncbi:alpha/beta hydrolase [Carboxylicivirga caseinilyticus]|uniref:alpha/beta hydrolase n=1 Tax=Carboxylicivirga caseinilyticus TaxID=3417572 RepID=UPI002AA887F2|nr:alpha/beta hydrolase [uncultured Carboxylicivirga sp.]MCU4164884.1 alpha/beta hydrolase [Marinilabiliaceae bacterium A049]
MDQLTRLLLLLLVALFFTQTKAQKIIKLYNNEIEIHKVGEKLNSENENPDGLIRKVISPSIEMYSPEGNVTLCPAVIICPGGGYSVIVYQGEGITTAKKLAANGVVAFVLKYRLPDPSSDDSAMIPLQDAQKALKIVRENASEWNINPEKIGIMGFSAGGHLASTLATHYDPVINNPEGTNLRPDFQILVYPVISMSDSLTHLGSRTKLLGENPDPDEIIQYSSEWQVTKDTPPAYITHAADDNVVDVDNSIFYFEQLRHHQVPVEMHIYPKGNHGFIFKQESWIDPLFLWMKSSEIL